MKPKTSTFFRIFAKKKNNYGIIFNFFEREKRGTQ